MTLEEIFNTLPSHYRGSKLIEKTYNNLRKKFPIGTLFSYDDIGRGCETPYIVVETPSVEYDENYEMLAWFYLKVDTFLKNGLLSGKPKKFFIMDWTTDEDGKEILSDRSSRFNKIKIVDIVANIRELNKKKIETMLNMIDDLKRRIDSSKISMKMANKNVRSEIARITNMK